MQKVLSLRIGQKHGSFAISNKSGTELYQLAYCTTGEWDEKELTAFFAAYPILQTSFYKVMISYDFSQSLLVSSTDYKQEDAGQLLNILGSNSGNSNLVSELIPEWQLCNMYAAPKEIEEWFRKKYTSVDFWHQYSLGIKNIDVATDTGRLVVDVRSDDFTLIAVKGNKFLLSQTFEYSTPDDVLYYLLRTCQQFSLSQQEILLQLSGLIDMQSSLYNELSQYFINVEFREANWNVNSDHPVHFFTSLNDLARCAS